MCRDWNHACPCLLLAGLPAITFYTLLCTCRLNSADPISCTEHQCRWAKFNELRTEWERKKYGTTHTTLQSRKQAFVRHVHKGDSYCACTIPFHVMGTLRPTYSMHRVTVLHRPVSKFEKLLRNFMERSKFRPLIRAEHKLIHMLGYSMFRLQEMAELHFVYGASLWPPIKRVLIVRAVQWHYVHFYFNIAFAMRQA